MTPFLRSLLLSGAAVALTLATACGTAGRVRDPVAGAPTLGPAEGAIVVSVVTDDPAPTPEPLASAAFAIRGPDGAVTWLDSGPDDRLDRSSDFPGEPGQLHALVLPAGDYRVTDWRVQVPPYTRLTPKAPFAPLAFRVEPGQVRYLGELHMGFAVRQKPYGLPMLDTGRPGVRDRRERDLAVLATRWPGLDPMRVESALLDGASPPATPSARRIPSAPNAAGRPAGESPAGASRAAEGNPPGFTSQPYDPPVPTP